LEEAEREAANASSDRSAVASSLRFVRDVCAGAGGTLVAQGLVAIITPLLG
jgi:hypothetical protein